MSKEFYNPYHFVPLSEEGTETPYAVSAQRFRSLGPDRPWPGCHDRYEGGRHSGRIVCDLTVVTPLVVGARQSKENNDENGYTLVEGFQLGGEPAIPATALKGLISSIAEAASGSALRVFDTDFPVTYRRTMGQALSAIGRLEKSGDDWYMAPLAMPIVETSPNPERVPDDVPWHFEGKFGKAKHELWIKAFPNGAAMKAYFQPDNIDGLSESKESCWTCLPKLPRGPGWNRNWEPNPRAGFKNTIKRNSLVIGCDARSAEVVPESEKDRLRPAEGCAIVKGVIRAFGRERSDMPNSRKFELFIPDPDRPLNPSLRVLPQAVARFDTMARERAMANKNNREGDKRTGPRKRHASAKPYLPYTANERENWEERDGVWVPRLRPGQLLYFDIKDDGEGNPVVSVISFSSIWRDAASMEDGSVATLGDFVAATSPELLPYNRQRQVITMAERMFGFVEASDRSNRQEARRRNVAYRGHIRFGHGRLHQDDKDVLSEDWVPLKILASPKPPSPALYFRLKDKERSEYTAKAELRIDKHRLQGTKLYLRQAVAEKAAQSLAANGPWKTQQEGERKNQKNKVRPVRATTVLRFHVDFDNLSDDELDLLCFALRPTENFCHKLGMGKPLGLGTVRIDPVSISFIDRKKRYSQDSFFCGIRYHDVFREVDSSSVKQRASRWREQSSPVPKQTLEALVAIGEQPFDPVHSPLAEEQTDQETKSFQWFVNNDHRKNKEHQHLKPIDLDGSIMPLNKNRESKAPNQGQSARAYGGTKRKAHAKRNRPKR